MEKLPGNVKDIQDLRAKRLGPASAGSRLLCLNFKVPTQIRHQFKIAAARHNVTMTELLLRLVVDFTNSPAGGNRLHKFSTKQTI
jgi:hypothetical protein